MGEIEQRYFATTPTPARIDNHINGNGQLPDLEEPQTPEEFVYEITGIENEHVVQSLASRPDATLPNLEKLTNRIDALEATYPSHLVHEALQPKHIRDNWTVKRGSVERSIIHLLNQCGDLESE